MLVMNINEETGQFNAVTKTVPVTIYGTEKDETINNESDATGEDLVTNTVQYVNKKTGQIIRIDKYTGEKIVVQPVGKISQLVKQILSKLLDLLVMNFTKIVKKVMRVRMMFMIVMILLPPLVMYYNLVKQTNISPFI